MTKALIPTLARDVERARGLASPNPEDDLAVCTAIARFSYNSPTDDWGRERYLFVKQQLDGDYSLEALDG